MICRILPFLFMVIAHAAEFSVYLTPSELTENGESLTTVTDLNIDVNGKAIPIDLVEGRQSISYPCSAGTNVELFRVADDERQTRTRVAATAVPAGATQGLLVISPAAEDRYKIIPFWFAREEVKKGSAVFVNLSGRPLGIICNGERIKLSPNKRWIVSGKFDGKQMLVPTRVEIFWFSEDNPKEPKRLIDRRIGIPKDDTGIHIILPKQKSYITLLSFESGGLRDPASKAALEKQLPPDPKAAPVPAG